MEEYEEILERTEIYLDDNLKALWKKYLHLRKLKLKKHANQILNELIESFQNSSKDSIKKFTYELLSLSKETIWRKNRQFKYMEEIPKFGLQHQLIERIIVPVLIEDFNEGKLGSARELSRFEYIFRRSLEFNEAFPGVPFPEDWQISEYFLNSELERNPNDTEASKSLLFLKISRLDYDVHELPRFGLLVEIDVFEKELSDLKVFIKKYNIGEEFKEKIEIYDLIQKTWKDYITSDGLYNSYEEYLEINKIKNREKI